MLPIKYRDDDSYLSDFSLHSSVDKETQTEPKCITEQTEQVIVTAPGVTGQDIEKVLEYRDILNDTGIIDTNIRIENVNQFKPGVLSAHSSHGTFIIGNILQREDAVESHLNKYWKLDESIEREFPNSGYVYIPCVEAENDKQEDTSNKVCIFIPNQETREHLENNKDITTNQLIEITSISNSIKKSSFHSKASKDKVSAHRSFISNAVEDQTNLNIINSKENMPDNKPSNSHEPCSPSEIRIKRLSNFAQGLKDCLSNTISAVANPICKDICNKPKELRYENTRKIVTEEKVEAIHEMSTPRSLETNTPSEGLIAKISKSITSLVCKAIDPCTTESKSTIDPTSERTVPQIENPTENKEKEEEKGHCGQIDNLPENKEKEKEIPPSSPNRLCGPVITYPCPPPPKPRKCSFDMESTETIESRQMTPLINEMSPSNNEFATEDYVFNNNQLTPMNIEVVDKLSEDARIRTDVNDVVLSAAASNTTDDYSSSNAEFPLNSQNKEHIPENSSGSNQKTIRAVEPTVRDFIGLNLDRISEKSERKMGASGTPSSEHIIRMVTPKSISHSDTFAQPPRRGLFTAFKSTIFRFFGDKNVIQEHSDISCSSVSNTSSDTSED